MNNKSRTKNSFLNLIGSITNQIILLFLTFITRRVFIKSLGIDYLGISGLFGNLLELFSLAELGISSAIVFSMYKYLAEKNEKKLQELINYYKILYNRIALIVLLLGLMALPFLKYIIHLETSIPNIETYYLIYLLNSAISYLFVYKTTIVYADQSDYKLKWVNILLELLKNILQITVLIVFKNYLSFLFIQIGMTFLGNLINSKYAENLYPFIKEKAELPVQEKKELWNNIKSMFFYKIGGPIMNNTDNLLISILVSTTMVGIYSNYTMIYLKIYSFINLFFSSIMASVGNLNVNSTAEQKYKIYNVLSFISYILFSTACIGIWFLADDVVIAISGSNKYVLTKDVLTVIIMNFYCMGLLNPNVAFRQTTGLFKMAKYSMLICCILNIGLSIALGYIWGLLGIILASVLSRVLTNVWYEPYILYSDFFKKDPKEYYLGEIKKIVLLVIIIIIINPLIDTVRFNSLYLNIFIKFIICCTISSFILWIVYHKKDEFQFLKVKLKEIFNYILSLKNKVFR